MTGAVSIGAFLLDIAAGFALDLVFTGAAAVFLLVPTENTNTVSQRELRVLGRESVVTYLFLPLDCCRSTVDCPVDQPCQQPRIAGESDSACWPQFPKDCPVLSPHGWPTVLR